MTQIDIQNFLISGAFLRTSESKVSIWVGLEEESITKFEATSIYVKEFFNQQAKELKARQFFQMNLLEFLSLLESQNNQSHIKIHVSSCEKSTYESAFKDIMNRIHRGEILKAVPVMFAESKNRLSQTEKLIWLKQTICQALKSSERLWAYGFWQKDQGCIGATPEVLFRKRDSEIESMALAGSCPRGEIEKRLPLLKDPKEIREHQYVVEDIKNIFSKFGVVTVGSMEILEFPQILHLKTSLKVKSVALKPLELMERMHPTAALGVTPRNYGIQWLESLPGQKNRKYYGAPLMFPLPDGCITLVGIRTLQWDLESFRIGSGGGLVQGSDLEQEWKEIMTKWKTTSELLGIDFHEH